MNEGFSFAVIFLFFPICAILVLLAGHLNQNGCTCPPGPRRSRIISFGPRNSLIGSGLRDSNNAAVSSDAVQLGPTYLMQGLQHLQQPTQYQSGVTIATPVIVPSSAPLNRATLHPSNPAAYPASLGATLPVAYPAYPAGPPQAGLPTYPSHNKCS